MTQNQNNITKLEETLFAQPIPHEKINYGNTLSFCARYDARMIQARLNIVKKILKEIDQFPSDKRRMIQDCMWQAKHNGYINKNFDEVVHSVGMPEYNKTQTKAIVEAVKSSLCLV